jgi:hypothetical protein
MQILIFVLYSVVPDFIQFREGYLVIFAKEKPQEIILGLVKLSSN